MLRATMHSRIDNLRERQIITFRAREPHGRDSGGVIFNVGLSNIWSDTVSVTHTTTSFDALWTELCDRKICTGCGRRMPYKKWETGCTGYSELQHIMKYKTVGPFRVTKTKYLSRQGQTTLSPTAASDYPTSTEVYAKRSIYERGSAAASAGGSDNVRMRE